MTFHGADTLSALTSEKPSGRLDGLIRYVANEVESSAVAMALVGNGPSHRLAASVGYHQATVDYLLGQFASEDPGMQLVYEHPGQLLTWADIPSYRSTYSAERVLIPAGFHEGTSLAIPNRNGKTTAILHLSIVQPTFPPWLKEFLAEVFDVAVSTVFALEMHSKANLTRREVDVLRHLAEGLTNTEIGEALCLSKSTVNTHVEHILHKLGARNRLAAAVSAFKCGLLD